MQEHEIEIELVPLVLEVQQQIVALGAGPSPAELAREAGLSTRAIHIRAALAGVACGPSAGLILGAFARRSRQRRSRGARR